MREILFRGKRVDNGEWAFGDYANCANPCGPENYTYHYIITSPGSPKDYHEIYTLTVCQYTGMKDRNGKRIFEGDIVRTKKFGKIIGHANVNDFDVFKVQYEPCMFRLINKNRGFNLVDDGFRTLEVIGNIFDNPELLEEYK